MGDLGSAILFFALAIVADLLCLALVGVIVWWML